ncbi:hypothetical protein [Cohnella terricola]|uniref:PsbP C-terminal domain-containing protein n=1 Tax=Cohnella terricola TaxID=1289167 RepID=A0A559J9S9_9BACL|nr:hypothetical protein [Cohnella terricola]TVX96626.1 hypothetical protein FPZ45_20270 [Cohnella terricola]
MRRLKVLLFLFITGVIIVGCSSQTNSDNYETVTYEGLKFSIPKEWTSRSSELSYSIDVEEGEFGLFYIYTYPYPRDVYKSKFIDWEDKTYKDIYKLSEEKKLKKNMTMLTYKTDFNIAGSDAFPDHVVQIIVIDDHDRVLEVSLDMPRDYYEQNSHILKHIQNSLTFIK